jgi:[ribosomal protein S5]-alanine N-acetyltransferase
MPVRSGEVLIRAPRARDERAFLEAVRRSRRLHRPWVSPPATPRAFREYLRHVRRPSSEGFLVCVAATGEIAGVVNVTEIVRGCFQSAYLGYYAFSPHDGRGLMKEGLGLALSEAFGALGLHRLEANIQPGNRGSIALVRSLGFRREGLSPRYLSIGGRWRDHERWAILAEEWGARIRRRA